MKTRYFFWLAALLLTILVGSFALVGQQLTKQHTISRSARPSVEKRGITNRSLYFKKPNQQSEQLLKIDDLSREIVATESAVFSAATIAPDAEHVAFGVMDGTERIAVHNLQTNHGRRVEDLGEGHIIDFYEWSSDSRYLTVGIVRGSGLKAVEIIDALSGSIVATAFAETPDSYDPDLRIEGATWERNNDTVSVKLKSGEQRNPVLKQYQLSTGKVE